MKKAVFFDLFQTLVRYDPPREQIIADALRERGISATPEQLVKPLVAADEFMYQVMAKKPLGQHSPEERMALYIRHHEIIFETAGLDVGPETVPELLKRSMAFQQTLALFDDVAPAIDDLKARGVLTGLISNVDTDIAAALQNVGLDGRLDVVMTSQEAGATKPHPKIFEAALRKAGVDAGDSIFIGDQYDIDVVGARGAGMTGILVDRTGFYSDITDCPRITSFSEIKDYL